MLSSKVSILDSDYLDYPISKCLLSIKNEGGL